MGQNPTHRTVVVTGVSSGIGYVLTRHLLDRGFQVFGSVRKASDRERLESEMPAGFTGLVFDVTDRASIDAATKQVSDALQGERLFGLVNNAGIAAPGPMELLEDDKFDAVIQTSLMGTRNATNAFLPLLRAQPSATLRRATIVNVTSLAGVINTPMNGAYCIAKHAQESLSELYRRELTGSGIDVATIQPGPIESELWRKSVGSMERFEATGYRDMVLAADDVMRSAAKGALPASAVAVLVERILERRHFRTSFIITKRRFTAWLMAYAIPTRLLDRLMAGRLNGGD